MGELFGTILSIVATVVVFIVIIMGSIYPAIKDNGNDLEEEIRGTNYGYHVSVDTNRFI